MALYSDRDVDMKESYSKDKAGKPEPDYYMENGLFVFTSAYHLKRGFCCKNQCRHCPYGKKTKTKS
jgi:Family of unknown function (DUF5522)